MKHFYYFIPCRKCGIAILLKYLGEMEDDAKVGPEIVRSKTMTIPCPRCHAEERYQMSDVQFGSASFKLAEDVKDIITMEPHDS